MKMFAAALLLALNVAGAEAALRRFNFTVHSATRSPGMEGLICSSEQNIAN